MAFQLSGTDPQVVFAAIAALIFLGFAGNLIFSKLRFNDTLILIAVGVFLGPLSQAIWGAPLVAREPVIALSSVIGPLALILILFDGGLALQFRDLLRGLGSAAALSALGFVLSMMSVGLIASAVLEIPLMTGLILGAILGGTSALVVMPSLQHIKCSKKTATTLGLESALTDVLVVVVSFTLMSIAAVGQGPDPQGLSSSLTITFIVSLVLGGLVGLVWLWMIPYIRQKPFGYMLTLGVMFFLYVAVEWLLTDVSSGGGPLAVLAFGVLLGNHASLGPKVRKRVGQGFGEGMKKFQGEIAFLVRTFFFVFLGILVELSMFRSLAVWALGIVLYAALVAVRYVVVAITSRRLRLDREDAVVWTMMPRGLASAVLAAVPASAAYQIAGSERFVALAFLILMLTNLHSTIGALVLEKMPPPSAGKKGNKGKKGGSKGTASKT